MSIVPLVLALLLPSARADEPADQTAARAAPTASLAHFVCLADGQVLGGHSVEPFTRYRTVRIDDANVRVPERATGDGCPQLSPATSLNPAAVRTVVLTDGQELHGTPTELADGLALDLLDESRIYLSDGLVTEVRPLRRKIEGLEELDRSRAQLRQRKAIGVLAGLGLGVASAVVGGMALYGVAAAVPPGEEAGR